MSMENVQEDALCTPRRVQKCLFGSGGSSRKKKMHKIQTDSKIAGILSEEESDLGPMSPLELSDQSPSSCSSSPRIPLLSPNITPKRLSISFNMNASWDQVPSSACKKGMRDHTRISLKKAIQAVKHTARNEILPDSPRSLSNSPLKSNIKLTPNQTEVNMEEFVPGTPEREFGKELQNMITETPYKCESPQYKLVTPLTTQNKMVLLPIVHRRKSLNILDIIENSSPRRRRNTLKRLAYDNLASPATKLLKTDENQSVPKARAALFQDKDCESKLKNITLSPEHFYSNTQTKKEYKFSCKFPEIKQRRKSFTGHAHSSRRSFNRHEIGKINAGVSHGIKKIKRKANAQILKNGNSMQRIKNMQDNMTVQAEVQRKVKALGTKISSTQLDEHSPSPEIDINKRFFKTKGPLKRNVSAIVKINNIKLNVASDGTMQLNQKNVQSVKQTHKTTKLVDISFDATDLSVDEPEVQSTIEGNEVANILKVLEDDWAKDDYDSMEILSNARLTNISPLKPVAILNDVTMSPASELSNMTSSMNIKDISTPTAFDNSLDTIGKNDKNVSQSKYYPLFSKGYSSNIVLNESNRRPMKRALNWQLSVKLNGNDNQYQLDAGQKNFGAKQCAECGIIYQLGDPEDENAHLNYHNNKKSLKFPGWKTERVITEDPLTSSRVILIEPGDSKLCWKKVVDVLAYVDRDLGLVDTKLSNYEQKKVYLYIRDKAVIGILVAEHITTAHCMIPELLELDCCTAESSPAKCGINVVWTDLNHRRQGIATKLIDILRGQFYFGYVMSMDDIAFSIPTPSGKIFAEKYTKTRNFKVYS